MEILGGYKNNLSILLDSEKIEAAGQDILSITQALKQSFSYGIIGDMDTPSGKTSVHIDNVFNTKESLEDFSF
jgi:multidrug efflux pump subunit AcrB